MSLCGSCCQLFTNSECSVCKINVCENCMVQITISSAPLIVKLCNICYPIDKIYYFHCQCCDENITYGCIPAPIKKCLNCIKHNKTIANRATLPHYKAKNALESQFIPDIAKIIFDYYYVPRRYFKGEY
jgi:hypothetical protein